jgi:DNA-binding PucR family transcriptional regulator
VLLAVRVPPGAGHARYIAQIKGALIRGLERMGDQHAVAGLSPVTPSGQLRRAYREAREVARCIDRYGGPETRAVGCDELGPARLFVANSDEHSVRLYVHDVLGPLLGGGDSDRILLFTLQGFFDKGRRIRETATSLGVHENTIRHRLTRVHELTGLDVAAGPNDQLSVQTALLVLRLQGHRHIQSFDRGSPPDRRVPA